MIRGIHFSVPNEYGFILNGILRTISAEKYEWSLWQDIIESGLSSDRFKTITWLPGEQLIDITSHEPKYYPLYVYWIAFNHIEQQEDTKGFNSYQQFLNSNAVMFLEIFNVIDVYFYSKDVVSIENMRAYAENKRFEDVELITDENDCFWV